MVRCQVADPRENFGVTGSHLQQQLLRGGPEPTLGHDPQIKRIGLVGVVLEDPRGRAGTVAADHHRPVGVQQKGSRQVVARQG